MAKKDMASKMGIKNGMDSVAITATAVDGVSVDTQGFNSLSFAVGSSLTAGSAALSLKESDDNVTFTTVPVVQVVPGSTTLSATIKFGKIGYAGFKRYVKITVTPTGATGNAWAMAILQAPDVSPVL